MPRSNATGRPGLPKPQSMPDKLDSHHSKSISINNQHEGIDRMLWDPKTSLPF